MFLCFIFVGQLSEHIPSFLLQHTVTFGQMFVNGFQDAAHDVAMEAMRATIVFVDAISGKSEVEQLQMVISPLIASITAALQNGNEELVQSGFDVLGTFMQLDRPVIDDSIEIIVPMCVNVLDTKDIDPSILNAAAQTLVTAFECRPKLISKKNMVAPIITAMVNIIAKSDTPVHGLNLGSIADNTGDDDDDDNDDGESPGELAKYCLDTMACSVSAKHFAQPALSIIAECFQSTDSKLKGAGATALGTIAEGCTDAIKPILSQIVPQLLALTVDENLHIREASVFAAGQLAQYCQPDILWHHEQMLPAMLRAMDDTGSETLQGMKKLKIASSLYLLVCCFFITYMKHCNNYPSSVRSILISCI